MIGLILDIVAGSLILLGGAFCLVAAAGVVRMPDVFVRMHASTKAGTLGVGLIGLGACVHVAETGFVAKALLIIAFMILTAPVGAHLLGRAAFRSRTKVWDGTELDPQVEEFRQPLDSSQSSESPAQQDSQP